MAKKTEETKSYKVVAAFWDAQDKEKRYEKGDTFPQPVNKKNSDDRIKELSTKSNKEGRPFIKESK